VVLALPRLLCRVRSANNNATAFPTATTVWDCHERTVVGVSPTHSRMTMPRCTCQGENRRQVENRTNITWSTRLFATGTKLETVLHGTVSSCHCSNEHGKFVMAPWSVRVRAATPLTRLVTPIFCWHWAAGLVDAIHLLQIDDASIDRPFPTSQASPVAANSRTLEIV
jgi:hypothetical protein